MGQDILKGYGMETQNRRITAQDMSSLPRYADGGLVGKIKGIFSSGPEETVTQKYARQDAERAAKAAKAAPAPVTPTPAPAISSYAGNTALQAREKAAGLKKGGAVRGPGTGTSDDVPIMASNGEFMIKASAVKKIGIEALEALNAIGDKPGAGKKKGAIREMATGIPHMESAGSVDEAQRRAQVLANIPTGGNPQAPAAQPANWNTDTDLGRNVNNTIGALAPVAVAAPLAYGASRLGSTLGAAGNAAFVAPSAVKAYGTAAAGLGTLAAASAPSANPVQSPVSPQAATNPAGTSPASPFAGTPHPMGPQIDPDAPSLRGRPGADVSGAPGVSKFVENGKTLYSNVAGDNADMMDKRLVGITPGAQGSPGGAVRTLGSYVGGGADEALQAARMAAVNRGDIESVRSSFGGNFNAPPPAASGAVRALSGSGYGILSNEHEAERRAKMDAQKTKDEMRGMSNGQARVAADLAGQASQRGIASAQNATAQRGQDINAENSAQQIQTQQRGQDIGANSSAAANQLARDKFGLDAKSAGIDQQSKVQLGQLQSQYLAEKDPAKKAEIVKNMAVLQNHFEKPAAPDKYNHGQIGTNPDGTPVFGTYSERTGLPPQGQGGAGGFEKGKTYKDAKGNVATWDGQKFVPTK